MRFVPRLPPGLLAAALASSALGCVTATSAGARPRAVSATASAFRASPGRGLGRGGAALPAEILWSYRAGAPLAAPPGVGAGGAVAVGSVDGYLHVLRSDGSFLWGYTLRGPVIGRPVVTAHGEVVAAADPNGLYALDVDGTLLWVNSVYGGVRSPPVVDGERRVWITSGAGILLGFSPHGGVVSYSHVGPAWTLGPTVLPDGGVAIARVDGGLRFAGSTAVAPSDAAGAPLVGLESAPGNALFVLGRDNLARFDTGAGEARWSRRDVVRLACAAPDLIVVEHEGLRWLSASGEPLARVPVSVGRERPLACLSDGSLLALDDAGTLLRVDSHGVRARATLPAGRLVSLEPTHAGLVVAGYRDGRVLGIRPPG